MKVLCALLLLAGPVLAQPAPPPPAAGEDPADVVARVRYERAIRAEFDGRNADAIAEARACIEARPQGRFADAARELISRLERAPAAEPRAPAAAPRAPAAPAPAPSMGPRTELVIDSTLAGLYLSSLLVGATQPDAKGGTAMIMLGTGGALLASIYATSGRRIPESMPQMLGNGLAYGTYVPALALAIGDSNPSSRAVFGTLTAGATLGAAVGLFSSLYVPSGDAAAISTGMVWGGALPVLIEATVGPHGNANPLLWTALIGSTAGVIAGPILNHSLRYSRGRWNLISLGGGVGALMGAGFSVLFDAWKGEGRAGFALTTAGSVAGLVLMGVLTKDFDADEARSGTALLHFEDGRLQAGNLAGALAPARLADRSGAMLNLLDGRF